MRDEEGSRLGSFPILAGRYLPTSLVGKGGFSEVFQACFDLDLAKELQVNALMHMLTHEDEEERLAVHLLSGLEMSPPHR